MFKLPQAIRCRLGRHAPIRSEAAWDGSHFVGTCSHCKTSIRRIARGKWKTDWQSD